MSNVVIAIPLFMLMIIVALLPLLIGVYVYRDAKRRGMPSTCAVAAMSISSKKTGLQPVGDFLVIRQRPHRVVRSPDFPVPGLIAEVHPFPRSSGNSARDFVQYAAGCCGMY